MNQVTYVCGHRNPDTDAIVAAIAYAALQNMVGANNYVPARLGSVNDETAALLKKFGFPAPMHLYTVRTQVRDIEYDQPPRLGMSVPVSRAWTLMQENPGLSALPVIREDDTLYGMVTAGGIAESDMSSIQEPVLRDVPVYNVLSALEGHVLNREEDVFETLNGPVYIALPTMGELLQGMPEGAVVLCGQQEETVEAALKRKASCIILCRSDLGEKFRGLKSRTCMINTPLEVWQAARLLYLSTPIGRVARTENVSCFHLDDFLDDVRDAVLQSRYRSYPVLDADGKVVGTLGRYHLLQPRRKRIVLVDHNEVGQSVPGLEQAELIGIIDHHRLADVQTGYPVFMRNEPVGSTNTIIATMFQEQGLMPGAKLAGLMAGAIISDTVMFKSPTTTPRDRRIAERLAGIAGIELEQLGQEIFAANIADKSARALLETDFKEFHLGDHRIGIGQITTMDAAGVMNRKDELTAAMQAMQEKKEYDMVLLMVTDVLRDGTELLFLGDPEAIKQAFNLSKLRGNRVFLKGVMSRKKQVVPALTMLWG